MKILVVSSIPTDPLDAGNRARLVTLIQSLQADRHDVHVAHIHTVGYDAEAMARRLGKENVHFLPFLPQPPRLSLAPRVKRIVGRRLRRNSAFLWSLDSWYDDRFTEMLRALQHEYQFEVVFVTYVFMSKAFEAFPAPCLRVLDTHDRFAQRHREFIRAGMRPRWFSTTLEEEERGLRRADVVLAIQPDEAEDFRGRLGPGPPHVLNVGHLIAPTEPAAPNARAAALFLGSSNPINGQGAQFFIDRVLPLVRRVCPAFELVLAGSVCDEIDDARGIVKLSHIDRLRDAFESAMIFVNPVLMGTGVNIKLLDALAAGMPCVSSQSGARGLGRYRDAMVVVPDNDPESFARAIVSMLVDPETRTRLRSSAIRAAADWNAEQLGTLQTLLSRAEAGADLFGGTRRIDTRLGHVDDDSDRSFKESRMRVKLTGNDNRGAVFLDGDRVIREVSPEYMPTVAAVVDRLDDSGELGQRIVSSHCRERSEIEHERLTISYPFEWSPSMLRDVMLLQLDLWIKLQKIGLTLKDAMPTNYLFKAGAPVLVDLLTVVPGDQLEKEEWLVAIAKGDPLLQTIMRNMFVPYFGVPLLLAAAGDNDGAHRSVARCMNPYGPRDGAGAIWRSKAGLRKRLVALQRYRKMQRITRDSQDGRLLEHLRGSIEALQVMPEDRGYLSYYDAKGEAFDYSDPKTWKPKQRSVAAALERLAPQTVLDLGANTGWFSILAAHAGAKVVATDIDVSCVDALYRKAHAEHLDITCLHLTFAALEASMLNEGESVSESIKRQGHLPAIERLRADVVLCLGLVHHLTLGEGREIVEVLRTLRELTNDNCVVEFVSLDDPLVMQRPDYFSKISSFDRRTYNEEVFEQQARKVFREVERMPSHPETRTLWLLRK
jgi:glycosyltransferase involved in cell wall biosynthesis/SAM-dependent methyltransferase